MDGTAKGSSVIVRTWPYAVHREILTIRERASWD